MSDHTLTHRSATADDYAAMQTLVRERYAAAAATGVPFADRPWYPSAGDIDWWRCTTNDPNQLANIELWYEADQLLAFVWHNGESADIVTHFHAQQLYPTLLEWAEQRAIVRQAESSPSEPASFEDVCFVRDPARRALLEARGYAPGDHAAMQDFRFDLTAPLPARRALPEGFFVRNLGGEAELEARVAAHRAAFAPSRMTVAKHRAVLAAPMYRPAFDLVVEAPGWPAGHEGERDGELAGYAAAQAQGPLFAAFALVWYDEANRMGVFEPVGCRPQFQRRGLASAVITEGLHRLRDAGATHAWIGAWLGSPGEKTYTALTGPAAQRHDFYKRTLTPATA